MKDDTMTFDEQDLQTKTHTFAIYQLDNNEENHKYCFTGTELLEKLGMEPLKRDSYNLVYVGVVPHVENIDQILSQLYQKFNVDHPLDFRGHSLSVSDVIGINQDGNVSYHYVDSYGFKEYLFENHLLEPVKENPINQLIDLLQTDMESLVNALSTDYGKRIALERAVSISELKSQLFTELSFKDLSRLNDYCHDVWLKEENVEFVRVKDFAVEVINENIATIDQIVSMPRREFCSKVFDGDPFSLEKIVAKRQPIENRSGAVEKSSILDKLKAKPEPCKAHSPKPKAVER